MRPARQGLRPAFAARQSAEDRPEFYFSSLRRCGNALFSEKTRHVPQPASRPQLFHPTARADPRCPPDGVMPMYPGRQHAGSCGILNEKPCPAPTLSQAGASSRKATPKRARQNLYGTPSQTKTNRTPPHHLIPLALKMRSFASLMLWSFSSAALRISSPKAATLSGWCFSTKRR